MTKETIQQALNRIQKELKAPKGQRNSFGNYNYRSCEDILEAVKPLLGDKVLVIKDEIVNLGDRFYVKATATLSDDISGNGLSASAYARESLEKKGMDSAQITGSTSSYARKYALNGLFCIDDTKDADSTNTHGTKMHTDFKKEFVKNPAPTVEEYENMSDEQKQFLKDKQLENNRAKSKANAEIGHIKRLRCEKCGYRHGIKGVCENPECELNKK